MKHTYSVYGGDARQTYLAAQLMQAGCPVIHTTDTVRFRDVVALPIPSVTPEGQLRGTKLITIGLGGALAWFIFLIGRMRGNAMIGLFLAVTVAALIAELQARIRRTPVLVMEVPLLVPLIPGGDLYRMTVSIMKNGIQASLGAFVWLVQEVFIIAAGVICVQTVVTAVVKLQRSRRHTESSTDQS